MNRKLAYLTANCNELVEHQFEKAIKDVHAELGDTGQKASFEAAYYDNGQVKTVVFPQDVVSPPAILHAYDVLLTLSAFATEHGGNIDPAIWSTEFEGTRSEPFSCGIGGLFECQTIEIESVTPNSFLNSSNFKTIPF